MFACRPAPLKVYVKIIARSLEILTNVTRSHSARPPADHFILLSARAELALVFQRRGAARPLLTSRTVCKHTHTLKGTGAY